MTEEELKQKCTERAKIFQQAMESCHSSSPIDCIEWFADKIAELEKGNAELKEQLIDVRECFISASSGDDYEMAESAREVMEVLDISCYRHKEKREKSKLTIAKELLRELIRFQPYIDREAMFHSIGNEWKEAIYRAEQFLKDKTEQEEPYTEQEEPYYVILNMNCQYEICRKCPKSGLFFGTYEECEEWIREKESEVEK